MTVRIMQSVVLFIGNILLVSITHAHAKMTTRVIVLVMIVEFFFEIDKCESTIFVWALFSNDLILSTDAPFDR
jgi:hypothetical protein